MNSKEFDHLKTKPEDREFHSSRVMFWIINEVVEVAPKGTQMSHLEMAEDRGWFDETNKTDFFEKNVRGFYLKREEENRLHFYRGLSFGFDQEVIDTALRMLPKLVEKLGFDEDTEVYFGPKDSFINGVEYPIKFVGKVQELT